MRRQSLFALLVIIGAWAGSASAGDVNINIGAPPVVLAPPIITARPHVVAVPGSVVFTAPDVEFNVFLFGGRYWSHHNDVWFVAPRPGAPWTRVAVAAVPAQVRAVPVKYYKVKPKHAKSFRGDSHHPGKGKGH